MKNHSSDIYIPVAVPVIIEKERFERLVVRRTSQVPRNKASLHGTLLTRLSRRNNEEESHE